MELPTTFDERFKDTSGLFFYSWFNLLRCELDNFTFKVLYDKVLSDFIFLYWSKINLQ